MHLSSRRCLAVHFCCADVRRIAPDAASAGASAAPGATDAPHGSIVARGVAVVVATAIA
jgi:hypothetical protein